MKWSIFFKKLVFGLVTGASASVSSSLATGVSVESPEALLQMGIVSAVSGCIASLVNLIKHWSD